MYEMLVCNKGGKEINNSHFHFIITDENYFTFFLLSKMEFLFMFVNHAKLFISYTF